MSIIRIKNIKGYKIVARIRDKNAKGGIVQKQQSIPNCTKEYAKKIFEQLKEELRNSLSGSLKNLDTVKDVAHYYIERKGFGGNQSTIEALIRDIGSIHICDLKDRFDKYLILLKQEVSPTTGKVRMVSTVNRYISCLKAMLNLAVKNGQISTNPIKFVELEPEEARDRVWNEYEKQRLFNVLESENSYLYWIVYFSQWNPIRKGDLLSLTKDNLDMFQPWVHFYPSKTKKRRNRETCLVCIDTKLMNYFRSLPQDCPYLFPKISSDGSWSQIGDFKKHWKKILKLANIDDFHFHDLKHCSITWMLDNNYTERDLKNLGIQYTSKMIDRYYKHDARKVLKKWKNFKGENICENKKIANS